MQKRKALDMGYLQNSASEDEPISDMSQMESQSSAPGADYSSLNGGKISSGADPTGQAVQTGATTLATTGNPYIAAAATVGSYLTASMQSQAEDSRQRRALAEQKAAQYVNNQNSALSGLNASYARALLR